MASRIFSGRDTWYHNQDTRIMGLEVEIIPSRLWSALAAIGATLWLTGCGSSSPNPPATLPSAQTSAALLHIGAVTLTEGAVWQLNNPGGGTPRESLTIQSIHGHQLSAVVYLGEFGSLIQANLKGTWHTAKSLTLSGTLSESTVTGSAKSVPIQMLLQPVKPHTLWVTQSIPGDTVNSFSQIPFQETSSNSGS